MNAEEKQRAIMEDIRYLVEEVVKMPKEKSKREAKKVWIKVRLREAEYDFEHDSGLGERPYYVHCCKTCEYKLRYSKKYGIMHCAVMWNAENSCMLVKKWMETRKKELSK